MCTDRCIPAQFGQNSQFAKVFARSKISDHAFPIAFGDRYLYKAGADHIEVIDRLTLMKDDLSWIDVHNLKLAFELVYDTISLGLAQPAKNSSCLS